MGAQMLVRLLQPDPILLDDPVRPKISPQRKLSWGRYVYMWIEGKEIGSIVCTAHRYNVPKTERELFQTHKHEDTGLKVILYSIWSYKPGCGSKLVNAIIAKDGQYRIITMSPKTEMARQFHLKNGAKVLQTNKTSVNYEY
jgi:hypothetical protein